MKITQLKVFEVDSNRWKWETTVNNEDWLKNDTSAIFLKINTQNKQETNYS